MVGDARLERTTRKLLRKTGDLTDFWPLYRDHLRDSEREWFASRGEGSFGSHTLVKSGGLLQSLTGGSGEFYKTTPKSMEFGTRHPYKKTRRYRSGSLGFLLGNTIGAWAVTDLNSATGRRAVYNASQAAAEAIAKVWRD